MAGGLFQLAIFGAQDLPVVDNLHLQPNYNVLRIMSGMAYDGTRHPEEIISTRDLGRFEYKFSPERASEAEKPELNQYVYNCLRD